MARSLEPSPCHYDFIDEVLLFQSRDMTEYCFKRYLYIFLDLVVVFVVRIYGFVHIETLKFILTMRLTLRPSIIMMNQGLRHRCKDGIMSPSFPGYHMISQRQRSKRRY